MQSILSRSIPIKDVIYDLAKGFSTPVFRNCNEYHLNIPEIWGKGSIKGINFNGGLGIICFDCTFNEDLEIQYLKDEIHPLKFIFCETGKLSHRFEDDTGYNLVQKLENIIVASCQNYGHIMQFTGGLKTMIYSLEIDRNIFETYMDCELKSLKNGMEGLFRDTTAQNSFFHHGHYSIKMANLFTELNGFSSENFLRKIFMQGSVYNILWLQILQYQDDQASSSDKKLLRSSEIDIIRKASAIINHEILDFTSVKELASQVGFNPNKLQNGFKELYDITVNGYVHNRRMDLAINLLKNSDFTISEIVYKVGLSSKSYFSKIFKDKYGVTPSDLRNKIKSNG